MKLDPLPRPGPKTKPWPDPEPGSVACPRSQDYLDLNAAEFRFYCLLHGFWQGVWPDEDPAEVIGPLFSPRQIERMLSVLEHKGLIER